MNAHYALYYTKAILLYRHPLTYRTLAFPLLVLEIENMTEECQT